MTRDQIIVTLESMPGNMITWSPGRERLMIRTFNKDHLDSGFEFLTERQVRALLEEGLIRPSMHGGSFGFELSEVRP